MSNIFKSFIRFDAFKHRIINQYDTTIFFNFSWMQSPDRREIYYPPQILYGPDGERSVLFGTGGSERSGALYVISITDLLERDVSKVSQSKYETPKLIHS